MTKTTLTKPISKTLPEALHHVNFSHDFLAHMSRFESNYEGGGGLYYFTARWVDPVGGRFIGTDPASPDLTNPLSLNPYVYCLNNPLKFVDPDGRVPLPLILAGVGGATNVALDFYGQSRQSGMSLMSYARSGDYGWGRAAGQFAIGAGTTLGGGAIGVAKWGGTVTTLLARASLSAGLGMASTQASNMLFNENSNLWLGAASGVTAFGLGSGLGFFADKIPSTTTSYLGKTLKYGLEGYQFGLNPAYAGGQIAAQAGGDLLNFKLTDNSQFSNFNSQFDSFMYKNQSSQRLDF